MIQFSCNISFFDNIVSRKAKFTFYLLSPIYFINVLNVDLNEREGKLSRRYCLILGTIYWCNGTLSQWEEIDRIINNRPHAIQPFCANYFIKYTMKYNKERNEHTHEGQGIIALCILFQKQVFSKPSFP